tara:strand:+ start:357 stop:620 length:264 start_codon:yes stop_codon:yes gene_type:complete
MQKETGQQIIEDHRRTEGDVGSSEVQIALMTERISQITEHLKSNKHDYAARRGLLKLVGRRSALLKYLARTDREKYQETIQKLGLRR